MNATFYVPSNLMGRVDYLIKKHDLRYDCNPFLCFDSKYLITISGMVEGFNNFDEDMELLSKYDHAIVEKSVWQKIIEKIKGMF